MAVLDTDKQGGKEFVADLVAVADLGTVGLGVVDFVIQLGPVDGYEGELLAVLFGRVGSCIKQRLGQSRESRARVEVKTPGGHGGSVGGTLVGEDARTCGDRMSVPGMLLHQFLVPIL